MSNHFKQLLHYKYAPCLPQEGAIDFNIVFVLLLNINFPALSLGLLKNRLKFQLLQINSLDGLQSEIIC